MTTSSSDSRPAQAGWADGSRGCRDGEAWRAVEAALSALRSLQDSTLGIYGRLEPDRALVWAVEELGELAQAVRRKEGRARLEEELGQLTAWMLYLANILDVDLATAVESAIGEEIERQMLSMASSCRTSRIGGQMIRIGLPKGRMVSEADRFCGALGVKVEPGVLSYKTMVGRLEASSF